MTIKVLGYEFRDATPRDWDLFRDVDQSWKICYTDDKRVLFWDPTACVLTEVWVDGEGVLWQRTWTYTERCCDS